MLLWPLLQRVGIPAAARARLRDPATLALSLAASIVAWLAATTLYYLGARGLGFPLGASESVQVFARSTLLGGVTLSPAGAGVTGSVAILELREFGVSLEAAVSIVTVVRLSSVGFALLIGGFFLWRELRGPAAVPEQIAHFDTIATEYSDQWSPHVWDLLLDRKLSLMADALPTPPSAAGIGLDLGCGLAVQATEMRRRGFHVYGVEPSIGLLALRRNPEVPVIAGNALEIPVADASVDFVYLIGVMHHLPGRGAQAQAITEIRRVLRSGGMLLVHESNPRNPFFRFYMGYLFPIVKSIDEGTEWWIDPREWGAKAGFSLKATRYFTFLPDFLPQRLLPPALAVERWLERGPTAPWSAHYLAVLVRRLDTIEEV
jgi:SAM-dependent methyltransferase